MKNLLKRLTCVFLSALMIISLLPAGVMADDESSVMTSISLASENIGVYSAEGTYSDDGSVTYTDVSKVSYKLPSTYSAGTYRY